MVGVDCPQCFFELVGTPDPPPEPFDVGELGGLAVGEVLGVVQQDVAGRLERLGFVGIDSLHLSDEIAAGLVEGFGGHGHGVEGVEADRRVGGALAGCFRVWGTEVHRDRLQLGGLVGAELLEERLQGDRCAVFGTPDDITGVVIDNQRQVLVAAFPGDLIDTDMDEPFDARQVRCGGDDPFDDLVDGPPRHPTQHGGCGAVHAGDTPHHEVFEVAGDPGAGAGEGHLLDPDPVIGARQTSERARNGEGLTADVEVPPFRRFGTVVIDRPG